MVAAYLVAAYRPFRLEAPRIENTIEVSDTGTLSFDGTAMARGIEPLPWLATAVDRGALDVRLEARTDDPDQEGPARLLAVSVDHREANLVMGQEGDDLVVRLRRPGSAENGTPPLAVDGVFSDDRWRALRLLVEGGRATVEVDGAVVATDAVGADPFRTWGRDVGLALGNEVTGTRGWSGQIRRATVDGGAGAVDLLDPALYRLPSSWWSKPVAEVHLELTDVVLNLAGFLPFGSMIVLLVPGRRPVLRSLGASFAMSAVMEGGQLAFEERDPSFVDLALNTAGGVIGATLVVLAGSWLRSRRGGRMESSPAA